MFQTLLVALSMAFEEGESPPAPVPPVEPPIQQAKVPVAVADVRQPEAAAPAIPPPVEPPAVVVIPVEPKAPQVPPPASLIVKAAEPKPAAVCIHVFEKILGEKISTLPVQVR